ncbi:MAG TPA: type I DNA topoisomerase [Anaerolineae bacterium]|nr:type I DNA topoisomerase [Anaerolineae bacterium]
MLNPTPVYTESGTPGTRGTCPVCGTNMFRMGYTPAHEGLPKPDPKPKTKKKAASKKAASRSRKSKTPAQRKGRLVIVESPAKARTIGRFLGRGYQVKASVGHVRDLYKSKLSVDVDHDFQPIYYVPRDKKKLVKELKEAVAGAEEVYLATDPDREGEAIAWHVQEATGLEPERAKRVVFHEITKSAIDEAFQHARSLDMQLVDAQQARRILDRLVGYKISPLLWRNVRRGLSAGRVQSVALRLVVEREREIEAFVPEEYWSIIADLAKREPEKRHFLAKLHRIDGKKFKISTGEEAQTIVAELEKSEWVVTQVKKGTRQRRPYAPFTTSTMQMEASRKLNFTARRTMRTAQSLYEGVKLGDQGAVGLITYMRTDSTNVAKEAQAQARDFIAQRYGESFLPKKPPIYRTKARSAQEAHEAIRPTSVFRTPESLKPYLSSDQYRLYKLIWQRFVASQMTPAIYDTLTVEVEAGPAGEKKRYLFRATGSSLRFPGFLKVYEPSKSVEEKRKEEEELENKNIPPLSVGELLDLLKLIPEQHFTQPPPRYTEASLVKALEQYGIGRPSTYATILSTIQDRGYVEKKGKFFHPTKLGMTVNDLLVEHFGRYINVDFTARMEEELDRIARGEEDRVEVLRKFYGPFEQAVEAAGATMQRQQIEPEKIGETCPECGGELVIREGRYGKFIGCSNYPTCRYTRPIVEDTGVKCPKDGGRIIKKRSRKGRIFYGCENWPKCDFVTWNEPINVRCPKCGSVLVKANKTTAKCANPECDFSMPLKEALKLAKENTAREQAAAEADAS